MLVYQKQRESIAATTLIRYTFYLIIKNLTQAQNQHFVLMFL